MKEEAIILIAMGVGVVIAIVLLAIKEIKERLYENKEEYEDEEQQEVHNEYKPYQNVAYHKVDLLTKNEYQFYQSLKKYVYPHGLQILAKIRLADLVNVNSNLSKSDWASAFSKIKSKHIDFAIARDMNVLAVIELDDSSHYRADRIQRDNFVNSILTQNGYKVIRTYGDMLPVKKALYDLGYDLERLEYPEYYN